MKVVILHQTVTEHDAVGNDIANMFRLISPFFSCWIFCTSHPQRKYPQVSRQELLQLIMQEENVLIYHHSNFWLEGEELLVKAKCRIIIRYHNVTPEIFFDKYDVSAMHACSLGREQTKRLAATISGACWMCASQHNFSEIVGVLPASGCAAVVPPLHNVEQLSAVMPDENILKGLLETTVINLLFVGRVVPNKNHLLLINSIHSYVRHFDRDIILWLVGKKSASLQKYYSEIETAINCFNLNNNVVFADECTDQQMLAYYLGCDFFLCASKHEGFCVPLIEAQALCLPVIASTEPAVAETLGDNQLIIDNDPLSFAVSIKELQSRHDFKTYLIEQGQQNYMTRFHAPVLDRQFKQVFSNFTGAVL
jgi:glycosyltransferase involved in cell wall biosynthesis